MASHAEWAAIAEDLSDNMSFAAQQYNLGQVSNATGLSQKTIKDSLTRRAITNPINPRGALCRPKYRVDTVPFWAPSQVQEFHNRQKLTEEARAALDAAPTIGVDEAYQRGLVTNREIVERLGLHDQTIRRYQSTDADYPPAVGKLSREGTPGVPEFLREWDAIIAWARTMESITVPEEWAA